MKKKSNAQEFLDVLKVNGITKLYHFTDRANLDSIIKSGGLYSWKDCEEKGIDIPYPGGGTLSRSLDSRSRLEHYVRVSFVPDHPMKFVAMNEGRLVNPVLLEIDLNMALMEGILYSDRNAARNGAVYGKGLDDLKRIHFQTIKNRYFNLGDEEKPFYQAEILVPHFIPLDYITNISCFGITLPAQKQVSESKTSYSAQITRVTPTAFVFMVDQSVSMSSTTVLNGETMTKAEAVSRIVNSQIEELVNRCIKTNEIRRYYDIALIGYGHEVHYGWKGELEGKDFVSPQELHDHPYKRITVKEEKRTRKGVSIKDVEKVQWIEPDTSGNWTHMHDAFTKAEELLEKWIEKYGEKDCYPPTIINITDGIFNDSTYEDMLQITNELKSMFTNDGNVQIFNVHISNEGNTVTFPVNRDELSDNEFGKYLYDFSSLLPLRYNEEIAKIRGDVDATVRHRAMAMNSDMATLIQLMDIGTPTNINNK